MTDHRRDIDREIDEARRRSGRRGRLFAQRAGARLGRGLGRGLGDLIGLLLLCVIVGFVLTRIGVDPRDFWAGMFERLGRAIAGLRENFGQVFFYLFYGAIIVVPVWVLVRVVKALR